MLCFSSLRAADAPSVEQRLQALEQYVGGSPSYEVARFSESPTEWILWSANFGTVLFVCVAGCFLVLKRKQLWLLPVSLGVILSFGWTWYFLIAHSARVFPYVICTGTSRTPVNFSGAYLPAWGLALSMALICRRYKKPPNQAPEPTPLRVTPAAFAPVAPRSVAARL